MSETITFQGGALKIMEVVRGLIEAQNKTLIAVIEANLRTGIPFMVFVIVFFQFKVETVNGHSCCLSAHLPRV